MVDLWLYQLGTLFHGDNCFESLVCHVCICIIKCAICTHPHSQYVLINYLLGQVSQIERLAESNRSRNLDLCSCPGKGIYSQYLSIKIIQHCMNQGLRGSLIKKKKRQQTLKYLSEASPLTKHYLWNFFFFPLKLHYTMYTIKIKYCPYWVRIASVILTFVNGYIKYVQHTINDLNVCSIRRR